MAVTVVVTVCVTGIVACIGYIVFLLVRERKNKSTKLEFDVLDDDVLDIPLK